MKPFQSIQGQTGPCRLLQAAVDSRRLAHAYLLAGPEGCGRFTMALDLVACLVCPEEEAGFCGECPHCRKVFTLNHPDVRVTIPRTASVTPEAEAALLAARASDGVTPLRFPGNTGISIGQIREIEARLSKKSYEGRGHGEIILDAHLMRREAANALLKTLEEPPGHTLIVLTTSFLSGVLPTVRSRCHSVRLGALRPEQIKSILIRRTGLEPQDAETLALSCGGSPGRALAAAAQWEGRHEDRAMEVIRNLAAIGEPFRLLQYAGGLARELGREGLLELCCRVVSAAQDLRRSMARGTKPLVETLPSRVLSDSFLERVQTEFLQCSVRLRGNVSPAMALEAAVLTLGGS